MKRLSGVALKTGAANYAWGWLESSCWRCVVSKVMLSLIMNCVQIYQNKIFTFLLHVTLGVVLY